ncbi:MAG: 2-hydroxyglutaryl-CoA dehydratase [Bacilli bacterium]
MSQRSKLFKKFRKEHYTILIPDMLPYHFSLISELFKKHGYNFKVVTAKGRIVKDEGLKSVHNDACYPALIVTGQFITELKSGKYDLNKTCVMMSQTGGGCRASNYISLIRKAIQKQFPQVNVLSLNISGLEKTYSLPLNLKMLYEALYCCLYGDFLMLLFNQVRPYETKKGQASDILNKLTENLVYKLNHKGKGFYNLKKNYQEIINGFNEIKIPTKRKERIGIVGEIYVKYSALANNNLVDFLVSEGYEPFLPSLLEFMEYCFANGENDFLFYGKNKISHIFSKLANKIIHRFTTKQTKILENTQYIPYEDFKEIQENSHKIISEGVKMGEGWLIPSEMITMALHGVKGIVCCQPFGCLPNHIVGKGMIRPVKKICPDINIAAIDYDPGATNVNQENRIKLMLSNIKK